MNVRNILEKHQIKIYFSAVFLAIVIGAIVPNTNTMETSINPALALMLFATFLQIPITDLKRALLNGRFLLTLFITNFIALPLLTCVLLQLLPNDPMIRLGVLLVLLTPCIDYVVPFSHLGNADAKLLLAATPALLVTQMLLLPIYLGSILGSNASEVMRPEPFVHAFIWMIATPLLIATVVQWLSTRSTLINDLLERLRVLPVPATALVLFIVVAAISPQIALAPYSVLSVLPIYILYAVLAPLVGWISARLAKLEAPASRAVAFSAGTRNSLVVLPLAYAIPQAPLLPAIIVSQTLIELIFTLIYIRVISNIGIRSQKPHKEKCI